MTAKHWAFYDIRYPEEVYRSFLNYLVGGRNALMLPWVMVPTMIWLLWSNVPHMHLIIWGVLAYLANVGRLASCTQQIDNERVRLSLLCFAWATNVYALIWGVGAAFFMPYLTFEYQLLFVFSLAGIAMGVVFLVVARVSMWAFPVHQANASVHVRFPSKT